ASWDSMARGKTAALFELCVFAGAIVAGRSSEDAMTLGAFGAATGQLFQLQDDYLDLVGDKGRDQPATDIAEGKISYPVAWAIEHGETALATELEAIVRRPRDATDATMVRRGLVLLRESGALDATAARLNTLAQEARQGPLGEAAQPLIQRILAPIAHAL
ncbi:MAG: octaprenyl-diphosphate synthase, partial [Myxococcota bacterium]